MTIFNGGFEPDITSGLLGVHSVKQMLFCIAQDDRAAREMDAYTILGISSLLEEAGYNVEAAYNRIDDQKDALERRHAKLRAALAACLEAERFPGKSDIAKILVDDEKEATDAD